MFTHLLYDIVYMYNNIRPYSRVNVRDNYVFGEKSVARAS